MKNPTLTTVQQATFKERAKLALLPPYDWSELEKELKGKYQDLWKESEFLKKLLSKTIIPLALELLGEKALRLVADRIFIPSSAPLESFFGYSSLRLILCLDQELLFFHPNMPHPIDHPVYLVALGAPESRYIHKPTDPENARLKKEGYAFGDLLKNETHPLFFR